MLRLSRLIPVRFRSTYRAEVGGMSSPMRSTWWQWRNRVWAHRSVVTASACPVAEAGIVTG